MIKDIISYMSNNLEEVITMLMSTVITIAVIMQRTKLNRKVKDMSNLIEMELTLEEKEIIMKMRENSKKQLMVKLEPEEKTEEETKKEQEEKEIKELGKIQDFINDYWEIYQEVKQDLNTLKKYRHKYKYNDNIENEIKGEE